MGDWLGHRDLCPSLWGKPCDCPCSDDNCPGRDRCEECKPIIPGGSLWTEESIQAARKHRTEDQAEDATYAAEAWGGDTREVW